MSVWEIFFGWPSGQVWPNLVASAVTSASAIGLLGWRTLRKMETHHQARMAQDREHHAAVMAKIGGDT